MREAIGAVSSSATVAKANTLATKRTIRIKDSANNKGDTVDFDGSANIELPLPKAIRVNLDSNTVVPSAQKLSAPVTISIQDKTSGNKGGTTNFDGSKSVILNLPATISSTLNGNANTASKLKNSIQITVTDGTNTGTSSTFDGSSDVQLQLPSKLSIQMDGNAATATKLKTRRNLQITDYYSSNTGTAKSFDGTTNIVLPLPSTIKAELDGNAKTATTLKTTRTLQVNLASTETKTFNGSANITIGVSGKLSEANGGTGKTNLSDVTVGKATKLTRIYNIDGVDVPYSDDGMQASRICINHYAYCSTAANTPIKEVYIKYYNTINSGNADLTKGLYTLNGARINVQFKYASTCASTSDVKLKIIDPNGEYNFAYPMYGPDGKRMYSFSAGLYSFTLSFVGSSTTDRAWYCSRIPGIENASSADQATKDGSGNVITSTYATKSTAIGSLSVGTGNKAGKIGYTTISGVTKYIDPPSNNVQQTKLTTGTYPILLTASLNQNTDKVGVTNFSPDIKIDVTNKTLTAPIIKATAALVLPTSASTIPGAIWLES